MKSFVSTAIIFVCLSNFTGVLNARLFQESKHLSIFASDKVTLRHQLTKRQTTDGSTATPEVMVQCSTQLSDILCTSGIAQRLIEADLSCGMYRGIDEAQKDANMCAKSEDGQYCKSVLELYRIRQSNYVEGNCSRVLTLNSCLSACRALLEEFRSELGCCINAYINGSTVLSPFYSSSLNYSVWNLCGVPLPPEGCGNSAIISPPDSVQNCTSEDLFDKYYAQTLCLLEQRRQYTDAFRRLSTSVCGTLIITPDNVKDLCSVNANGVPCGTLYYRSSGELSSLSSACSTSCTSDCRESISAAMDSKGCCLSSAWFNSSYSSLESCDIEPLRKCDAVIGSAIPIMMEKYLILIFLIAGLMLPYLLI